MKPPFFQKEHFVSFSLYLGPYQPFLEEQLLQAFQAYRQKNPFDKVTVLVPNFLLVGHLRRILTEKGLNLFKDHLEGLLEESLLNKISEIFEMSNSSF